MKPFIIYLIFINILTFFIYGLDKHKARKSKWRIPEKQLFFLAFIGGSIGAEAGSTEKHSEGMTKEKISQK